MSALRRTAHRAIGTERAREGEQHTEPSAHRQRAKGNSTQRHRHTHIAIATGTRPRRRCAASCIQHTIARSVQSQFGGPSVRTPAFFGAVPPPDPLPSAPVLCAQSPHRFPWHRGGLPIAPAASRSARCASLSTNGSEGGPGFLLVVPRSTYAPPVFKARLSARAVLPSPAHRSAAPLYCGRMPSALVSPRIIRIGTVLMRDRRLSANFKPGIHLQSGQHYLANCCPLPGLATRRASPGGARRSGSPDASITPAAPAARSSHACASVMLRARSGPPESDAGGLPAGTLTRSAAAPPTRSLGPRCPLFEEGPRNPRIPRMCFQHGHRGFLIRPARTQSTIPLAIRQPRHYRRNADPITPDACRSQLTGNPADPENAWRFPKLLRTFPTNPAHIP